MSLLHREPRPSSGLAREPRRRHHPPPVRGHRRLHGRGQVFAATGQGGVTMAARFESLFFISRFQAELDRLFQEALQIGESDLPLGEWQPSIDVVETPAAVLILAEVPGFKAADLRVEVRATRILIAGTKSTSLPEAGRLKFL